MEAKLESQARSLLMKHTKIDPLNLQLFKKSCEDVVKIAELPELLGITGRRETMRSVNFLCQLTQLAQTW